MKVMDGLSRNAVGTYIARRVIPTELRPLFGKRELTKSLGTKDKRLAAKLAVPVILAFDQAIDEARSKLLEVRAVAERATRIDPAYAGYSERTLADLREHGIDVSVPPPPVRLDPIHIFGEPAASMFVETQQLAAKVAKLERDAALGINSAAHGVLAQVRALIDAAPTMQQDRSRSVRAALDAYYLERSAAQKIKDEWERAFKLLLEHAGLTFDSPISLLTRDRVREWKLDALRQEKPPKPATINKWIGAISAVCEVAVLAGWIATNPAFKQKVPNKQTKKARLPFTIDHLNAIFAAPMFKEPRATWTKRQWLPLLSLFTGARLEELGQLTVNDMCEAEGIRFLRIDTIEDGQSVKTETSKRRVPLHPDLIGLGFPAYVDRVRREGHTRLFHDLTPNSKGKYTQGYSTWFGRFLDMIGLTDRRIVFHSFRHNWKDAARDCQLPPHVADRILGHAGKHTVGEGYGVNDIPLVQLNDEMKKIRYPGLKKPD